MEDDQEEGRNSGGGVPLVLNATSKVPTQGKNTTYRHTCSSLKEHITTKHMAENLFESFQLRKLEKHTHPNSREKSCFDSNKTLHHVVSKKKYFKFTCRANPI